MDRGAWRAIVHGVAKSQTQVSMHACMRAYNMKEKAFFLFFSLFFFFLADTSGLWDLSSPVSD